MKAASHVTVQNRHRLALPQPMRPEPVIGVGPIGFHQVYSPGAQTEEKLDGGEKRCHNCIMEQAMVDVGGRR